MLTINGYRLRDDGMDPQTPATIYAAMWIFGGRPGPSGRAVPAAAFSDPATAASMDRADERPAGR